MDMLDKLTVSTFEFLSLFPDGESARLYIEQRRWPEGLECPSCKSKAERITVRKGGYYRCNECVLTFTVRTGTIFERSHIPLNKWLYAMYLVVTARKGVSSLQLSKEIGLTQKSAWFMLQRIREACGNDKTILSGIIELDETYVGGKEANKHEKKKLKAGRGSVGKAAVFGMRERGGKTKTFSVASVDGNTVFNAVSANVQPGSMVYTDEHRGYGGLQGMFYAHEAVNHSGGEYKRGVVSTNGIESVWAVLKRGIIGTFHHVSPKHLGRYADEFAFRLSDGNVERPSLKRMDSLLDSSFGIHLSYRALTEVVN